MLILQEVIDSHLKEKKPKRHSWRRWLSELFVKHCWVWLWVYQVQPGHWNNLPWHWASLSPIQPCTQQPLLLQLSVAQVLGPDRMDASVPKPGSKALCCLMPEALEASPTQQPGFSAWGSSLSLAGLVIWKLNNLFDEFLIFSNEIFTNNCFHYLSRSI